MEQPYFSLDTTYSSGMHTSYMLQWKIVILKINLHWLYYTKQLSPWSPGEVPFGCIILKQTDISCCKKMTNMPKLNSTPWEISKPRNMLVMITTLSHPALQTIQRVSSLQYVFADLIWEGERMTLVSSLSQPTHNLSVASLPVAVFSFLTSSCMYLLLRFLWLSLQISCKAWQYFTLFVTNTSQGRAVTPS